MEKLISRMAESSGLDFPDSQMAVVNFTNAKTIKAVNERFVGHKGITDVISFDYTSRFLSDDDVAAEIFVCYDKAEKESHKRKNTTYAREIALYILHGFLHVSGYDDLNPADRRKMRSAERRIMKKVGEEFNLEEIIKTK